MPVIHSDRERSSKMLILHYTSALPIAFENIVHLLTRAASISYHRVSAMIHAASWFLRGISVFDSVAAASLKVARDFSWSISIYFTGIPYDTLSSYAFAAF